MDIDFPASRRQYEQSIDTDLTKSGTDMKDLAGKVAFVTGGANGLGLAMAQAFAGAGMKVVLADIEEDVLNEAVASFKDTNADVYGIVVDVTDREAMARAADEAEAHFGNIHVVCNNAGVATGGPLDTVSYEDWDWVLGVNVGGVVNGVQTFVERIKKHGEGGHIVNTASMAGLIPAAGGIYATSKFAVLGLSEALRADLEPHGIGVSVLCPGFVKTRIHEAERNRPAGLQNEAEPEPGEEWDIAAASVEGGIDPAIVGEAVLDGVKHNALYIFPHPEFKDVVEVRFNQILAELGAGEVNESQVPGALMGAEMMKMRKLRDD